MSLPPQVQHTVHVQVQVGFDANGLPQVIDRKINQTITGDRLLRVLGDAIMP